MAQPTVAPAPAETIGSHPPAPIADAPEDLGGIGILGMVKDGGHIEGEIEIVELNPDGFSYTKLATKPNVNMGWDQMEGGVTNLHAAHLAGVRISDVRIIPDHETPDGHGEHVTFALSEEIKVAGGGILYASMGEYKGPADGLVGRRLPEV